MISSRRERGISARGGVGDANPLLAIADALADSNWLEHRSVERAAARFDLPITHLVATQGLVQQGSAA